MWEFLSRPDVIPVFLGLIVALTTLATAGAAALTRRVEKPRVEKRAFRAGREAERRESLRPPRERSDSTERLMRDYLGSGKRKENEE